MIIYFTISSFDGVDASLLPANAASRVTETPKPNIALLIMLCHMLLDIVVHQTFPKKHVPLNNSDEIKDITLYILVV